MVVFDDVIVDIETNNKLSPIVNGSFLRGRNLKISLVSVSQSYFKVSKTIKLNVTHCIIMKILYKRQLQQIPSNHLSQIEFKDFIKLYKDCTKE